MDYDYGYDFYGMVMVWIINNAANTLAPHLRPKGIGGYF